MMKSSSKALMVGIFLGLLAWVLDAWISSVFFPDASFRQLLVEHDPGRTLYVRAVVVGLFFVFGIYTGGLLTKLEVARERERQDEARRIDSMERMHRMGKMESIGVLAGGVAHDFNNILQAMVGATYLAKLHNANGEEIEGYLTEIRECADRAARLCDQLLTFAGKRPIPLHTLEPEQVLDAVSAEFSSKPETRGAVQYSPQCKGKTILGNETSLREMVCHLLQNALEATQANLESPVVLSTSVVEMSRDDLEGLYPPVDQPPGLFFKISVEDKGCGIDPEMLGRVFDPFTTTKFLGRGLGLASVAGLARSFHGGVAVESNRGQGTRVSLCFPLLGETKSMESVPSVKPLPKPERSEPSGTVWVVDDEPLIRLTLERVLKKWDHRVRTAGGREEFMRMFHEDSKDAVCVLLDLTMPDASGVEVIEDIRAMLPELPVVVMSGYSKEQTKALFKEGDVSFFLHKPFTVDQLRDVLRRVLPSAPN